MKLRFLLCLAVAHVALAQNAVPVKLASSDVIPTGNEWIALPTIRAVDGAIDNFNVLSMRDRGLLEVTGGGGQPVLEPYFAIDGKPLEFRNPEWTLHSWWIPKATLTKDGITATLMWCAPPGVRAAFLSLTITNNKTSATKVTLGLRARFGALNRVTYTPVELKGELRGAPAPWTGGSGEVFSFVTSDTHFAWTLLHPGSQADVNGPPVTSGPSSDTSQTLTLEPGKTAEAHFAIGVGLEEYSATQSAKALAETIDREGVKGVLNDAATWFLRRTRTTGRADLDMLMNRNLLFTRMYAWGKALDTEQVVGITSRSPRYYVSAAYWDRDAMLWSFPALLDTDPDMARSALEYALSVQLRNTGTHSRFIDGVVLEDGLELDEADAPVTALYAYLAATADFAFIKKHRADLDFLQRNILTNFVPETGLFITLHDPQDEYRKQGYSTYDNALTWLALKDLSQIYGRLGDAATSRDMAARADALHAAILKLCVTQNAPGADGPILVSATDGSPASKDPILADVPPGSLLKLPFLGFVSEDDRIFQRTYRWLHSPNYQWSYSDQPFGLPGSYRLPFTTSWSVADHLRLKSGRDQAMKILLGSDWDGGIITEGVSASTGKADQAGRAFATAAGYVADAICTAFCSPPATAASTR
ncbi:glycoside hydrolase family 125 protein [Occallatibacter riparius]|uniref:Glycoside hydrolase family 125 protein n=1 Tax=Occallatibacter riparius TaxID=1002689 RepID=A0A9J7BQH6_9BACT|nr:glycoside hydrolase family 125 protein [Occallatibacter riparius]UWZ84839.1 glycoside hydrolase family 125 protein [Occallatibacter riparius]